MPGPQGQASPAVVVVISGGGSNLQAIIDFASCGALPARIAAVVSDDPDAFGLQRARDAGIDAIGLPARPGENREDYDRRLIEAMDAYDPALVVLAGFMRIVSPHCVRHYRGRMLNIHPSLLPAYRGLNTHARVLNDGATEHGCTIHFVSEELDGGPIVSQARIPIRKDDDAASLSARVQLEEHKMYPQVVALFASGRLALQNGRVMLDGRALRAPLILDHHGTLQEEQQ